MKKLIAAVTMLALCMGDAVEAQRRNASYDAQFPMGHSEWVFVGYVYNPDATQRHKDCQHLAKAAFKADVTTEDASTKKVKRWRCYRRNG